MLSAVASVFCLGACTGFESEYEKGVYDYEPLYCYQTIGAVDCSRKPYHRDAARLVNYYGPAPGKYDPPRDPKEGPLRPPPKVTAAYRDAEPVVGSAPAAAATREPGRRNSASGGDADGDPGQPEEEKSEWKKWLPLISVAFGALQVVAAFAL